MIIKYIKQTFIYLLEVVLVLFFLTMLISFLEYSDFQFWHYENLKSYDFVNRVFSFYIIYQILVFGILTLIDASKKDSILVTITSLKKYVNLIEYNSIEDVLSYNKLVLNKLSESKMMYHLQQKEILEAAELALIELKNKNITSKEFIYKTNFEIVSLEHQYEYLSLEWRLSFLLRLSIFK